MTTEQPGVLVCRDDEGNLYLRVPDGQKAAVERALAERETSGYLAGMGGSAILTAGALTPVGIISRLTDPGSQHGIIVIGGRSLG